ncbi:MAG: thiamine pyrophosphate-dependent enzyme [Kiloniellales bacterium]|nr:thiamine pyrophosphate-dependent enzyme [Kiloniellales bacterium]
MAGGSLPRRRVVARALAERPADLLVVTGLGTPTYDVAACGDSNLNFYLWGAMGSALPLGLGLALARPDRRVLVVTGDGELLMALGALATVGVKGPENLSLLVLDNEAYGETGGQASHTAESVDLCAVALGCRWRRAETFAEEAALAGLHGFLLERPGPALAVAKIARGEEPRVLPSRDGHELRSRFRRVLLSATD